MHIQLSSGAVLIVSTVVGRGPDWVYRAGIGGWLDNFLRGVFLLRFGVDGGVLEVVWVCSERRAFSGGTISIEIIGEVGAPCRACILCFQLLLGHIHFLNFTGISDAIWSRSFVFKSSNSAISLWKIWTEWIIALDFEERSRGSASVLRQSFAVTHSWTCTCWHPWCPIIESFNHLSLFRRIQWLARPGFLITLHRKHIWKIFRFSPCTRRSFKIKFMHRFWISIWTSSLLSSRLVWHWWYRSNPTIKICVRWLRL